MKKLEGLWVDEGKPISDSDRLAYFDLNQRILIKQMNGFVEVLSKLYKERENETI